MKKIKKLIFIIFLMCINIKTSYAAIKVMPGETFLGVDSSQNLKVADTGSNNISWTSSNPNIVTVSEGKIVGINTGEAYVKVTDGITVALCRVKVINNYVPVQGIKIDGTGETVLLNNTIKLNPTIYPINASNKNPTYISSNVAVASVDANGNVTARKAGTANISISIENKVVIYKINVVDKISLQGISVPSSIGLKTGGTTQLVVSYNPSNATDKNVSFKSSNPNVVTVSNTGYLTARAVGTATITVTATDGGYVTTTKVTVTSNNNQQNSGGNTPTTTTATNNQGNTQNSNNGNVKLSNISLNKTSLSLSVNDEEVLSVTYSPDNATNKAVTWRSNNTGVVAVYSDGKVRAIGPGTAVVTATASDGGYVAKCDVTVSENNSNNNEPSVVDDKKLTGIKLDKSKINIKKGAEANLEVIYTPTDASNKDVNWSSSNEDVVTVTNGKIKAKSIGNATIKVTSVDGYYQDKCDVFVFSELPIQAIAFERETQTVYVGYTLTLKTIATPENTLLENPIWTSSDEYVALVEDGAVTAVDVGTATITISDENNKITASTTIEVIEKPLPKLSITIEGYDLKFDPKVKNYKLTIGNESALDIKTNYDADRVVIAGNRDLKNGSVITVTVTGNNNTKTTYVIDIKKKGLGIIYFIAIASILLIINLIRIIINNTMKKKKKRKK